MSSCTRPRHPHHLTTHTFNIINSQSGEADSKAYPVDFSLCKHETCTVPTVVTLDACFWFRGIVLKRKTWWILNLTIFGDEQLSRLKLTLLVWISRTGGDAVSTRGGLHDVLVLTHCVIFISVLFPSGRRRRWSANKTIAFCILSRADAAPSSAAGHQIPVKLFSWGEVK